MAIIVADPAFFGAMKELAAIAKAIVESGTTSSAELIQAIGVASREDQKYWTPEVPKSQGSEGVMKVLIDDFQQTLNLIRLKSPDEAEAYAQFLLEVAKKTAASSKEGGFLGIGATRVSEQETAAIQRLADALGVSEE